MSATISFLTLRRFFKSLTIFRHSSEYRINSMIDIIVQTVSNLRLFLIYTFAGSVIWATFLAGLGYQLGENWEDVRAFLGPADIAMAAILGVLVLWYIYRQVKQSWEVPKPHEPEA